MTMNCEAFRARVAADPAEADAACLAHADECAACAAFAQRVRDAEWLIHRALRFDVAALRSGEQPPSGRWHRAATGWAGIAAVLVAGLAVWFGVGGGPQTDSQRLVAEILEHWHGEPAAWVTTDVAVSPAALVDVVADDALLDSAGLGLISYARSCYVRGRWVPHLVVQGEAGPVMLLLLPHESVQAPLPLDLPGEGLRGVILPVGDGSVAVLGTDGEPLEPLSQRVSESVEWSI